ncbi:MAG: hypothetical protein BWK78_05275 [Thiotrichaceae bacterium IS1]|nr:MAG: hypothetical protein BWK78_05275 [Thiotrichaceae bacterium IS1]
MQANLFNSKGNLLVAKAERKKLEAKYKEALGVYHEGEGLSKEASSGVLALREKAKQEAEKALKAYDKTLMEAYEKALTEAYGEGERLANYAGDKLLAAKIAVNIVQVLTEQQKCTEAETKFNKVLPQLKSLPDSHDKAFTLIGLAAQFTPLFTSLLQSSVDRQKPRCRFSKKADKRYFVLDEARKVAERLVKVDKGEKTAGKKTAMAYVEGYLAQLYIEQNRYDEAIKLTNQAIFHTQESVDSADLLSAPAQLFRWEWQLGKLFDLQKDSEKAINVYRQAAKHLEITKQRCGGVSRAFLKEGENFYYEYAELLHRQSVANNEYLEELTCVIDSFKTTQLQNYFYSGCPYDIIDNTRRLRGSDNRGIMTCFDKKSSTPTAAALSSPSVATTLSYPFVFANSVVKNITSLLGISHSIMPQFGSIGLSVGLRKPSGGPPGLLKTQALPASEEVFKFDAEFFRKNPTTAVLYLFMFDRNPSYKDVGLELLTAGSPTPIPICLLPLPDGSCDYFNQIKTNVKELENKVNAFRTAICKPLDPLKPQDKCKPGELSGLTDGKDLYQWLIAPFIPHLQGIDTLILVPNSVLHTLPFAALQDENGTYLIERYALVVEPAGSQLTALSEKRPDYGNILFGGFSKEVVIPEGEFSLLNVNADLENLRTIKAELEKLRILKSNDAVTSLVDDGGNDKKKKFTVPVLESEMGGNYSIVHLTTHGSFKQDSKNSFLLTYPENADTEKTTLLKIDRFRKMFTNKQLSVELLTLSACQSAIGDKDAALGLAGVAVGTSRGAVGTLWSVHADATIDFMKFFYKALLEQNMSKAQALKQAMNELRTHKYKPNPNASEEEYYKHPYYWAAFLVTGNWF